MNDALHQLWNKRTKDNLHRFNKKNSIWTLDWKYYRENEKAMVIVGASPSLLNDVGKLKELDDNFIILCANSSLKFLLKNNIKPHYVVCVDADGKDIPKHLDIEDSKDITLLASTVVCGEALDKWKGPIYYMPYYSIKKELRSKVRSRLGRAVPSGGNSITSAFYVASIIFGSRTVIFVGNEYCFDKVKQYYADPNAAKQEKLKTIFPVTDVLGRQRWTLPAHYNYAVWTQQMCDNLSPQGHFIDSSFGILGRDCKSIHVMYLDEAIKKVKWSFRMRDELNKVKSKEEKSKIIERITGKHESNKVYRYNVSEHIGRILQLNRS
jgi:hypothetical protein